MATSSDTTTAQAQLADSISELSIGGIIPKTPALDNGSHSESTHQPEVISTSTTAALLPTPSHESISTPLLAENPNVASTHAETFPMDIADAINPLGNFTFQRPVDFFGRAFEIRFPLSGFAVVARLSRYVYGVIDPLGSVHTVHAAQLKQFLNFAYRAVKLPNEAIGLPIGYREFIQYLHADPLQPARLTVIGEAGGIQSTPNTHRYPLEIDFPKDSIIEEALELLEKFGSARNKRTVDSIILATAARNSHAPYTIRNKPFRGRGNRFRGSDNALHSSNSFGIAGGRM